MDGHTPACTCMCAFVDTRKNVIVVNSRLIVLSASRGSVKLLHMLVNFVSCVVSLSLVCPKLRHKAGEACMHGGRV